MSKKTEVLNIRCTQKQKNLLQGKAKMYGKSLSQFILDELIGVHGKKETPKCKQLGSPSRLV